MSEEYHPDVDVEFILQKIQDSGKVIPESRLKIGDTTTFVAKGDKPMHKRHITVREFDGKVNFEQATGKAALFGFMGALLKWLEENRDWREGEYVDTK